jgi:isoleucyl-tRNA synthetase
MRLAIDVASLGRSARSAADFKLRQPLAAARVHVTTRQQGEDLRELADVLTEEINVKQIEVVSEVGELVSYKLLPNNRLLGPRLGQHFPSVRRAIEALDAAAAADTLQREGALAVTADGQTIALTPDEVLIQTESKGGLAVASERGITVAVETTLTPELVQEGYARDLVRAINTLRKDAGLAIDDRVVVVYEAAGVAAEAFANFADYLRQETLAVSLDRGEPQQMPFWKAIDLEGEGVVVGFGRA